MITSREILRAEVPLTLPTIGALSVNQLYINRKQGGRALSETGRSYKRFVVDALLHHWIFCTTLEAEAAYVLEITFYFPAIYNAGWPKKAKRRFKEIDTSNFVKFFQDCVCAATGIGDQNHVEEHYYKREDPDKPRVVIRLLTAELP